MYGGGFSISQPFVFPSRPSGESRVDVVQDCDALRAVVPPVIVHPSPHHGIDQLCQVFEPLVVPNRGYPPCADGLPDSFGRLGADRRQETDEVLALPVSRPSWLECVAQEIERHIFMTLPASGILAVDDPGLLGMKIQTALGKALPDRLQDRPSLALAPTVDNCIIRISLETQMRERPLHP